MVLWDDYECFMSPLPSNKDSICVAPPAPNLSIVVILFQLPFSSRKATRSLYVGYSFPSIEK